jgi:hypothetical protein
MRHGDSPIAGARRLDPPPIGLDENEKVNELKRIVGSPSAIRRQESPLSLSRRTSPSSFNHRETPSRREPRPPPSDSSPFSTTPSESTPATSRSWSHASPAKDVRLPQIHQESPSSATNSIEGGKTNLSSNRKALIDSGPFGRTELKGDRPSLYEQLQKRIIAKPGQIKRSLLNTSTESAMAAVDQNDDGFFRRLKENLFRMSSPESKRRASIRRRSSAAHEGGDPSTTHGLNLIGDHGIQGIKLEAAPRNPSIRRRSSAARSSRASIIGALDPTEEQEPPAPHSAKAGWPSTTRSRFQGASPHFSRPGPLSPHVSRGPTHAAHHAAFRIAHGNRPNEGPPRVWMG